MTLRTDEKTNILRRKLVYSAPVLMVLGGLEKVYGMGNMPSCVPPPFCSRRERSKG